MEGDKTTIYYNLLYSLFPVMMGTAILPLNVTAEISPLASIFAYAILSNGKIAADTEKFPVVKCFNNKVN